MRFLPGHCTVSSEYDVIDLANASKDTKEIKMIIDVQCHIYSKRLTEILEKHSILPQVRDSADKCFLDYNGKQKFALDHQLFSVQRILEDMKASGVTTALISSNLPELSSMPAPITAKACSVINEELAELSQIHKGIVFGIGNVPWTEPDDAQLELERVKKLGLKGVMLYSHSNGVMSDDARMEPSYALCGELDIPIVLHPNIPVWFEHMHEYRLVSAIGFMADTSYALARLIYSGMFTKYPKMKVVMPHAGGVLPYLAGRISRTNPINVSWKNPNSEALSPMDQMKKMNIWYDTVAHSVETLKFLRNFVSPDKILFGTDHPYADYIYSVELFNKVGFEGEEREKVLWKNANSLFNLGL